MAEHTQTSDNIHIQIFDASDVASLDGARETDPEREYHTHNTTRDRYHQSIVDQLNGVPVDLTIDALVLGDSTASTANIPDSDPLGNETLRISTTDSFVAGQQITISTFLDSTVGVGQTFEEAALVAEQSGGDIPINRFLISDPSDLLAPKSVNETVTIDIQLTQEDA